MQRDWEARRNSLDKTMVVHVNNTPARELTTVELFYDH